MNCNESIDMAIKNLNKEIDRLKNLKLELKDLDPNSENIKVIASGYVIETPSGNYHLDRDFALVKIYKKYNSALSQCDGGKIKKVYVVLDNEDL